jgi:hypothetical protein
MATMNIFLPDPANGWIEERIRSGHLRVALRSSPLRHMTSLPNDGKKFDEGG